MIILISDMIILKEKVAGYNNVLTLATKDMKFRLNEDINYIEPVETVEPTTLPVTSKTTTVVSKEASSQPIQVKEASSQPIQGTAESVTPTIVFPKTNETTYLLGSAVALGFLVTRYMI